MKQTTKATTTKQVTNAQNVQVNINQPKAKMPKYIANDAVKKDEKSQNKSTISV